MILKKPMTEDRITKVLKLNEAFTNIDSVIKLVITLFKS